ncbi:MAG: AtpZ/AtpI family protein [Desulfatiglandaceae bacterium]|jgi:ATP synthase protein I
MDNDLKKTIKDVGYLSTVGMAMALSIAIGAVGGYYLDRWLGTQPWLFVAGLVIGIAAAFKNLYTLYTKAKKF